MKKLCKLLVTLVFCMGVLVTTLVPSFAADALSQVKSLKATATHNTVTLTWKKVSGAKGYEVQQYKNKKWVNLSAVVTSTTYKASKLTTGTTYKFRVRAYKTNFFGRKNGYGKYSATVSAKTVPGKVATVKVSATTATTATSKATTAPTTATTSTNNSNGTVNTAQASPLTALAVTFVASLGIVFAINRKRELN